MKNVIARFLVLTLIFQALYIPNIHAQTNENQVEISTIINHKCTGLDCLYPFQYAVFSGSEDSDLQFSGWKINVDGNIHSNSSILSNCSELCVTGECEAVQEIKLDGYQSSVGGQTTSSQIHMLPNFYDKVVQVIEDEAQIYYGSTYFDATEVNAEAPIIINGSAQFNNMNVAGKGYILADESITFNLYNLTTTSESKVCYYSKNGDIIVNASNADISGILYAPNGRVILDGYDIRIKGRIIAKEIILNASLINIKTDPSDLECINLPPIVEAEENQEIDLNVGTQLMGNVDDDGLMNPITTRWKVLEGSGEVEFEDINDVHTEVKFSEAGEYILELEANDGQYTVSDTVTIEVKKMLQAMMEVSGTLKQNRKITLDASKSSNGKVIWTVEPLTEGVSREDIKWNDTQEGSRQQELIFKQPGDYKINLEIVDGLYTANAEQIIKIEPDVVPIADFTITDTLYYRTEENNKKAYILLNDLSYSPDSDAISKRVWSVRHDSNNDGLFDDEEEIIIDDTNQKQVVFKPDMVGRYEIELQVVEKIIDTLPQYMLEEDYLRDDTKDKAENQKRVEVLNKEPVAEVDLEKEKAVDIVVTVGTAETEKIIKLSEYVEELKAELEEKDVNATISSVSTSSLTAQDEFAWEVYDHFNYELEKHITIDNKDICMRGYTKVPYKDFLFVPDTNKTQKTFTFNMQRDNTDWHSMEGGGFLFNTSIENNMLKGYCVLATYSGIKLIQIKGVDVTRFRNGSYEYVQNAGVLLDLFGGVDPKKDNAIKIVVNPNSISMWCNDELIIDEYQLPDDSYGSGFGPITSHISHWCSQRSYFTFKNIKMETVTGKSLNEALEEYNWQQDASHFVINLSDGKISDLGTDNQVANVAKAVLEKSLKFIGLGTEENYNQYKSLLDIANGEGLYEDTTNFEIATENMSQYILNTILARDYSIDNKVVVGEKIAYINAYTDKEEDSVYEEKWQYNHDCNIYENNTGTIECNLQDISKPITIFDKTGAYGIKLKVRDNPVGDNDYLDQYRKWSDEDLLQKVIMVHRKPIAKLDVKVALNEKDNNYAYINVNEVSYDLDHESEANKGIIEKTYKWKNIKDIEWTEGSVPNSLPINEEYLVYFIVKDKEGVYSEPCVERISTNGLVKKEQEPDTEKPTVTLELSKYSANVGDEVVVDATVTDNFGVEFLYIYVNDELVSTNKTHISFYANQEKEMVVKAEAIDAAGNASEVIKVCKVKDPTDRISPIAKITYPDHGSTINGPVQIVGTAKDETKFSEYVLSYRLSGEEEFIVFGRENQKIENGVLGEFDTTYLEDGIYDVRLTVKDIAGNEAYYQNTYIVGKGSNTGDIGNIDTQLPQIDIGLSKTKAEIGEEVEVTISVVDDVAISSTNVYISDELVMEAPGKVTFSKAETQIVPIKVVAMDSSGNIATKEVECQIIDTRDQVAPIVEIITPTHGSSISSLVDIIGTVKDETKLLRYQIQYAPQDSEDFITFAEGTEACEESVLGKFNTLDLTEGIYQIKLLAEDTGGNNSYVIFQYNVKHVINSEDKEAPIAKISSPDYGTLIRQETPILGVITDETKVQRYQLMYKLRGTNNNVIFKEEIVPNEIGEVIGIFNPTGLKDGVYDITLVVEDSGGNIATDTTTYIVGEQLQQPEISLVSSYSVAPIGEEVKVYARITNNVPVKSLIVYADGIALTLDNGVAQFTPIEAKTVIIEAVVTTLDDKEVRKTIECVVVDTADKIPPEVTITTPEIEATITAPTDIIGTVKDEKDIEKYYLQYRLSGSEDEYKIFAEGTEAKDEELLGTFDPTLLQNGMYDVQLVGIDKGGNRTTVTVTYNVAGEMKIGHMAIGFTDISTKVGGVSINVDRSYDNRNKQKGDFGIGWNLGLSSINIYESSKLGANWEQVQSGNAFQLSTCYALQETAPHDITVTYGNGTSDVFEVILNPTKQAYVPIQVTRVNFQCKTNSKVKLELVESNTAQILTGVGTVNLYSEDGLWELEPFDPQLYKLTTEDGSVIIIDKDKGVQSITDKNGNKLTVSEDGIVNENGEGIAFTRDSEGRIIEARDLAGNITSYTYDGLGDLVNVTNPLGNSVTFEYNNNHDIIKIIDPRGIAVARNEYDENGRLVAVIDADGNRTEYTHDIDGRQEIIKDELGYTTVILYNDQGTILSKTDPNGLVTQNEVDANGNILKQRIVLGDGLADQITSYTYDQDNLITSIVAPNGSTVNVDYDASGNVLSMKDIEKDLIQYTYDANGNILTQEDALGNEVDYTYDSKKQLTSIQKKDGITGKLGTPMLINYNDKGEIASTTNEEGIVTTLQYDDNGNCTSRTIQNRTDSGIEEVTTTYQYDTQGNVKQIVDPEGNVTVAEYNEIGKISAVICQSQDGEKRITYTYDDKANLTKVTYPDQTSENFVYDAKSRVIEATDRTGLKLSYTYDSMDQITSITYPNGGRVENTYDKKSRLIQVKDVNGGITRYAYDENDKNTEIIDALGNKTSFEYNELGLLVARIDAMGNRYEYVYDDNGNQIKVIYPQGIYDGEQCTQKIYDTEGNVTKIIGLDGTETTYEYDEIGRLISLKDANQDTWQYGYNDVSDLTSITDPNGNTTHYTYNKNGQLIKTTLPLGMTSETQYDDLGRIIEIKDFNGNISSYTYDDQGNLKAITYADGSVQNFVFNHNGLVKQVSEGKEITSYSYDHMGQLASKTLPDGTKFKYSYDLAGNITAIKTPYTYTTYTYDLLGRIKTVSSNGNTTTYDYDKNGNRIAMHYANGVEVKYTYDKWNRLTKEMMENAEGVVLASYAYTLAPAGNRIGIEELDGTSIEYTYDNVYRLTKEQISSPTKGESLTTYTYDAAGNRLTKNVNGVSTTYTYDSNNRLLSENNIVYTYDNNGSLTGKSGDGTTSIYTYNQRNRLIKAKITDGNEVCIEEYAYDWENNRIQKTTNEVFVTKYVVDTNAELAQVLAELDSDNQVVVSYVYGQELISQTRAEGTWYYGLDGLNNVRMLFDEKGNITDTYTYDAFGTLLYKTGNTENNYLFNGQQYDANTGYYYLRARYMDPSIGRFITMDEYNASIFDPSNLHKYLYANANPINYQDPSGYFIGAMMSTVSDCYTQVCQIVNYLGILDKINTALVVYDLSMSIYYALTSGGTVKQIIYSMATGIITSAAINRFCSMSVLTRLGFAGIGLKTQFDAIQQARDEGHDDLVFTRTIQFGITLLKAIFGRCFTGETLIATADGEKAIAEIEVGDYVWAENIETGEKGLKKVTEVFVRETSTLVHVTVNDEIINTTETHLFYVADKGWIEAAELEEGDLLGLLNGETARVESIEVEYLPETIKVYNFTVEDWHNYYVAGSNVLVHNADYTGKAPNSREINKQIENVNQGKPTTIKPNEDGGVQKTFGGYLRMPNSTARGKYVAKYDGWLEWYVKDSSSLLRLLSKDGKWAFTTDHYVKILEFTDEVNKILNKLIP